MVELVRYHFRCISFGIFFDRTSVAKEGRLLTLMNEGKIIDVDDSEGNDSDGNASYVFSSGDEES